MRDAIIKILSDYVDTHNVIHVSSVVIELLADELIRSGVVVATRCTDCIHRTDDGHCFVGVEGAGYKKVVEGGYCDSGRNHQE